jgi:hypothetical protein
MKDRIVSQQFLKYTHHQSSPERTYPKHPLFLTTLRKHSTKKITRHNNYTMIDRRCFFWIGTLTSLLLLVNEDITILAFWCFPRDECATKNEHILARAYY